MSSHGRFKAISDKFPFILDVIMICPICCEEVSLPTQLWVCVVCNCVVHLECLLLTCAVGIAQVSTAILVTIDSLLHGD